jgi:outer membrane receptor protein involved in Fe transport
VAADTTTDEEMIVTARKREESLQDVPISITAFSAKQLMDRGITSNYEVADFTVNFNTEQQVGRNLDRPIIRGQAAPSVDGEPNASYFIDGVYVSGSVSTASLSILERVEVLRGPQSAQFGRATFSGAVNYVTRKPSNEFMGEVNTRIGSSEDYRLGGWISGPIIRDRIAYLLSANWDQYGGQWKNNLQPDAAQPTGLWKEDNQRGDNSSMGGLETTDFLAKLSFTPFNGTELNLKYNYTEGDDDPFPSLLMRDQTCYVPTEDKMDEPWFDTSSGAFCGTIDETGRTDQVNLPDFEGGLTNDDIYVEPADPGTYRQQNRFLVEYLQEIGSFDLVARASFNDDELQQIYDLDHNPYRSLAGTFNFFIDQTYEDQSFELRLATPVDFPVRGQIGVYYYDYEAKTHSRSFPGIKWLSGGGVDFGDWETSTTENTAVFGSIDWDLADRWTLSLEARYAEDEKTIQSPNGVPAEQSFDNFTPRGTIRYMPTDDMSFYLQVAKGNKPGDFNEAYFDEGVPAYATLASIENGDALVKEEEAWTYEVGAKISWLDNRLTTNASVFYIDWTNQGVFVTVEVPQEAGPDQTSTAIENAGKSRVYGLELETNLIVNEHLVVYANYGYTDAEFVRYNDEHYANTTGINDPDYINGGNLKGFRISNTPEHTVIFGAVATNQLTATTDAFIRADILYETDRFTQSANFSILDDREMVNVRTGLETDSWTLTLYVRNLTDDTTPHASLAFPDFSTTHPNGVNPDLWGLNPRRGRDWGAEFQYRF